MAKGLSNLVLTLTIILALTKDIYAQTSAENCILELPSDPLTAQGLATPFILKKGNCDQTNPKQRVFVEATVFDPDTKTFGVYHPLVINEGTQPAVKPIVPSLHKDAVVGLWFRTNSNSITLAGGIQTCVNGGSNAGDFGQTAFCNAETFFSAVRDADKGQGVIIPPVGNDITGKPCPTARFFGVVDHDPSNNIITTYLQSNEGLFAQDTKVNREALDRFSEISSESINALTSDLLNAALGCTPLQAPSMMEQGVMLSSMALNELQASKQQGPAALVLMTNSVIHFNNQPNLNKVNVYRLGLNQPTLSSIDQDTAETFCTNLDKIAPRYIKSIKNQIINSPSPSPSVANNLFTFMSQRYLATWASLKCDKILNRTSAIAVTKNKGVAMAVQFGKSNTIRPLVKRDGHLADDGNGTTPEATPDACAATCTLDDGRDIRSGIIVPIVGADNNTRDTQWGPLTATDIALVKSVKLASLWELPIAEEAVRLSECDKVKKISATIAEQHIFLDAAVIAIAKQLDIELPAEPNKAQTCWMCDIRSKTGDDYDLTYVKWLRFAHGKIFASIGTVRGNTQNTAVRTFADTSNKFVLNHMRLLESTGHTRESSFPTV
ncbi:hypothetical protein BGZ76_002305 [Entomortierella beljakovae]|nr:hypothetical protein BGZ76_002305 [Entomortierella beljakovae]